MNSCQVCQKQASKQCSACKSVYYCSIECQKSDWKNHKKLACKSYKLGPIEGKGMGMIASRDIKIGELVLTEDPVLKYEKPGSSEEDYYRRILDKTLCEFEKLPSHVQGDIMSLYCNPRMQEDTRSSIGRYLSPDISQHENAIKLDSICKTNAFAIIHMIKKEEVNLNRDKYVGLYLLAARINHSCLYNLQWYFGRVQDYQYFKGNTIKFKAISPIKKGEELTICYVDPICGTMPPTIQNMRSKLADLYFECNCEFCCSKDEKMRKEIESHRVKYWSLHEDFMQRRVYHDSCYDILDSKIEENPNMSPECFSRGQCACICSGKDVLAIGKDMICAMEQGKTPDYYMLKSFGQYCYNVATDEWIQDDEMAEYFAGKVREATLFMEQC